MIEATISNNPRDLNRWYPRLLEATEVSGTQGYWKQLKQVVPKVTRSNCTQGY
jgi:hypothetical protein